MRRMKEYNKEKYSFKTVSRDVLQVLNDQGIEQAHFVGVSLGTIIIRTIGEMEPDRVLSAVMCGAITRLNVRSRVLVWLGHTFKDRKSTRLNSSHVAISYAVFCLKKKTKDKYT